MHLEQRDSERSANKLVEMAKEPFSFQHDRLSRIMILPFCQLGHHHRYYYYDYYYYFYYYYYYHSFAAPFAPLRLSGLRARVAVAL